MKFRHIDINKIKNFFSKLFNVKTLPKILIIFIILQTITIAIVWKNQETKIDIISQELKIVQTEKDKVEFELKQIYQQYDTLRTNNKVLNDKLDLEKERILTLINNLQNSELSIDDVNEFKHKSETLQLIMNDYIEQINKLNKENIALKTENEIVKEENQDVKEINQNLIKTVNIAKKLTANNISVEVLNKRNKLTTNAKKVYKIKVCLDIVENKVIKEGNKTVYIRITDPNGYTLINEESNIFIYNKNEIAYSVKKDVYYENENVNVCLYWLAENMEDLSRHIEISDVDEENIKMDFEIKGKYTIDIFVDGEHIKEKYFVLK